jgi:hypothetical protein
MLTGAQGATVHDRNGVVAYQFTPSQETSIEWSRELRDVSTCDLTLPPMKLDDIGPWVYWVSVWHLGLRALLWRGPIQKITRRRDQSVISARDPAAFMSRTRTPVLKQWEKVDPAVPASEMWQAMSEVHDLNLRPVIRHDPIGGMFDYSTTASANSAQSGSSGGDNEQAGMMDQAIDDLTKLGLRWTVVAGVPLLGPISRDSIATLGPNDFLTDLELTRDGSNSYNDVVLRAPDTIATVRVDMDGLNLQTIQTVDNMFGVSNALGAAREFARYSSLIRDSISVPSGATLHPEAPVSFDQLVPSGRFTISAYDRLMQMELEKVDVTVSANSTTVNVSMDSVLDLPENLPELKAPDVVQHG